MRRPSAYAPLSVTFASGRTGTAIQEKHGLEGIAVWAAMIAAAKRGRGQIVFAHDQDWQTLGLFSPPSFTLAEFLKTTGRLKQTRTTRQGHVMYVHMTAYEEWNDDAYTQRERERKASKSEESNRNKTGRLAEWKRSQSASEPEPELDIEEEPSTSTVVKDDPPPAYLAATPLDPDLPRLDNGLPFHDQLELVKLLDWIGTDQDDRTPVTIRKAWEKAPRAARDAVLESMTTASPRHRGKWLVTTIIRETQRATVPA